MDEGSISSIVCCLLLVTIVTVTAPQKVQSQPCGSSSGGHIDIISHRGKNQKDPVDSRALPLVSSTPSAIKKDLFMSRGWGASGMPFSMFYLNHYTKAQKAYAQSQLQQQLQMQQRQLQQQNQLQQDLQTSSITTKFHAVAPPGSQEEKAVIHSNDFPISKQFPYGATFDDPVTVVSETSVQAEKLQSETDYIDNSRTIWRGSNTNASRRQYTVPQLFVSYGWGPMG